VADLKLTLLSPERRLASRAPVTSVLLTGSEGEVEILPGHGAFLGTLETGVFRITHESGKTESGVISSGFFEVVDNELTVVAETLEFSVEIDIQRAKRAQLKSEEMLKEAALEPAAFKKYQLKLQRALVRQSQTHSS
jgi:F-type H+-transporting ATPase subunit epsilon